VPRSGVSYSLLLDGDDMAFIVAAYRTSMQIEAVTAYAAHRKK
jgi:hypothetical protein